MAGGTGGHVFPALALARLLREQSLEVVWLGTERGLESRVIPAEGIAHRAPLDRRAARQGRARLARGRPVPPGATRCCRRCRVMRRHQPLIVVGLGGFVTGPGGVAAWLTRHPLIIHEQNAIAGFTNRCLAHLARASARSLSRQLRARGARARHRQPGAARHQRTWRPRRSASPGAADRSASWSSAAARARRGSMPSCPLRSSAWPARLPSTYATRPASAGSRPAAPATRRPACAPTCGRSSMT